MNDKKRYERIAKQFENKELPVYATFMDGTGYYVAKVLSVKSIPPDDEVTFWWTEGNYIIVGGDSPSYEDVKNDYLHTTAGFQNFISFVDPAEMKLKCFWFEEELLENK